MSELKREIGLRISSIVNNMTEFEATVLLFCFIFLGILAIRSFFIEE